LAIAAGHSPFRRRPTRSDRGSRTGIPENWLWRPEDEEEEEETERKKKKIEVDEAHRAVL
jgi:hypothetical protein